MNEETTNGIPIRFFTGQLHTILLYDVISKRCILEVDGEKIQAEIIKGLAKDADKVCVDFEGVMCTHNFLRGALGMLIGKMPIDEINDRICLKGMSIHDHNILNIVMRHCAKCDWEEKHTPSLSR